MILDEIKKSSILALKEKDSIARSIYAIVLNKATLENIKKREKGEELTDTDMIQIIQKTTKELVEEAENYKKANNLIEAKNIEKQKDILQKYLPKMMSAAEIENVIKSLDDKSIGNIMKHFKQNYAGKCDMRLVSEISRLFK